MIPKNAPCVLSWKIGRLEVWRLGGATEVGARAAAFGGDEAGRCAAPAKTARVGTADCADWEQIKGVLAHAEQGVLTHPQRTENRERRTERPCGATGETRGQTFKPPLSQTPNLEFNCARPSRGQRRFLLLRGLRLTRTETSWRRPTWRRRCAGEESRSRSWDL